MNHSPNITAKPAPIIQANNPVRSLAEDVHTGLTSEQKFLPPKYFYDQRGSRLFDQICELPEYYQTRTERALLQQHADELVRRYSPTTLVEYGAGAASKTDTLLNAMQQHGLLRNFVPIDVSRAYLLAAAKRLTQKYPGLRVTSVRGDFLQPIQLPYPDQGRFLLFLGSTIGNLTDDEAGKFLHTLAGQMSEKDYFLLGTDLQKDLRVLEKAYNDSQGITAKFNKNVLRVINRELGGQFEPDLFTHHARYNAAEGQVEMHLISDCPQQVTITGLDLKVSFRKGESILTEISGKYTRSRVERLLNSAGFTLLEWLTDDQQYFALSLSNPHHAVD